MKKSFLTSLFLLISLTFFAQGIAIQGIARDNASSAITNTSLTFTFSITKNDNTVLYSETQSIKTDNFGVFSHIVNSGNPVTNTFNSVDFTIADLKMKVLVNYNGSNIQVYNQAFQYTPYAHFAIKAANGVPTGAIMPFIGTTAPEGWVFCKGQTIVVNAETAALRAIVGNNAPNLQGRFLKGVGAPAEANVEAIPLNGSQNQSVRTKIHKHGPGDLTANSSRVIPVGRSVPTAQDWARVGLKNGETSGEYNTFPSERNQPIDQRGTDHGHTISGATSDTNIDNSEVRPSSYGVNYIIKL